MAVDAGWSDLEREYSPSSMIDDIAPCLEHYRFESEVAREALEHETLAYGSGEAERIDWFPALGRRRRDAVTVHVFFHGGYWQELDRQHASLLAPGFVGRGRDYAAVGYELAPHAPLELIVAEARAAVAFLYRKVRQETGGRGRLVVGGSSAGAHLAAMVALTDWAALGIDGQPVSGLVLLSGIYDLVPLVDTYINDALGLNDEDAQRLSPMHLLSRGQRPVAPVPAFLAIGEVETQAFHQQTSEFSAAWSRTGNPVESAVIAGRNHFDLVPDLSDVDTPLGSLLAAWEDEFNPTA